MSEHCLHSFAQAALDAILISRSLVVNAPKEQSALSAGPKMATDAVSRLVRLVS